MFYVIYEVRDQFYKGEFKLVFFLFNIEYILLYLNVENYILNYVKISSVYVV